MKNKHFVRQDETVNDCTFSKLYLHLIANYLANQCKQPELVAQLGNFDQPGHVSYQERIALNEMDDLIYKVSRQLGGMSFGLDVGSHIHPSDFGVVGYALMNCANLLQALDFAARYKHAMNEGLKVDLCAKGEYCRFQIKNLTRSSYIGALVELDFATALQLSRFLVGSQKQSSVKFIQVNFQHPPLGREEKYIQLFGCPVKFGLDTSEIIVSRTVLDLPVRSADPRLLKMYLRKVERIQQHRKEVMLTHQQVFTYVSNQLGKTLPCINQVAVHFNMSLSTLKKKLQQEGYNYTGICDAVRKNEAMKLVIASQMSLKEIGLRLGFANPSAFNRAFKRWTNMTPAEYRKTIMIDA